MKIYGSTEYIEVPRVGYLKLEVISQWNFTAKAVCFGEITSMGGDKTVIPYALLRCTKVFSPTHTKWKYVINPSDKITKQLQADGYEVSASPLT